MVSKVQGVFMKFLRIEAIAKKEIIQIWRDPLSLALAFMMPVLLLLIFGYAISLDVDNLTTIVYDADRSSTSRELTDELTASGYFSIVRFADSQREIDTYLDTGRARVAVSIPIDFAKILRTGGTAQLQIIVDGSDSNTATIALGYLSALTELYSRRIAGERITPLIEPRVRVWYNPDLKSRNFIIPGLIAVIMMVIAALLTSLTFAREWERGTMEQLISTPVKRQELILGKLIPYFLIGFIDMVLTVLMAVFLFDVPLRGNVFILAIVSGVFLFGALGLGIVISIVAKSQLVASQISMVATFLPSFLLSGFMFAISNMPVPLQVISRIIPARYFIIILKGIFLKGNPLRILLVDAVFLLFYGAAVFVVANKKLQKKMA
jgi:ABC-2 type transport system permease protein